MLIAGIFTTPKETYTTYEIKEPGFYRIDFLRGSAQFQTDVSNVVYSQVHRKNTFTFGNSDIYLDYMRVQSSIETSKMVVKRDSKWVDGVFETRVHGENLKLGYTSDTVMRNGTVYETTLQGDGYGIHTYVSDPIYGVKLEPLNFSEYQQITMSNDTLAEEKGDAIFHSMEYLKRRYDLSHIDKKDYVVATDIETARARLKDYIERDFPLRGFDTETTGLDINLYGEDKMVGIILASDTNTSTYFPFRHTGDFNLPMTFLPEIIEAIKKHEDITVAHNKKFDREVMLAEGYDIRVKWDSMQLSIVNNPVIQKGAHSLKTLMDDLSGEHFLELDEIFINPKDIDFSVLDVEHIRYYACSDATSAIILLQHLLNKLPKSQYKLACLECDLADIKADMEFYGIRVDVKKYERQYKNCNYILEMLLDAFRRLTHEDGNINSPQVLLPLLYNKMKCKVLMRTKTGQPSTSSQAIKKLAKVKAKEQHPITEDLVDLYGKVVVKASELANAKYPALVILAKYREYNKLKTAFYARFERTMKTGRVFFWVNQNGAATGRQSSPMHQLPPALKEVILSDADDRDFWGPDFSQIELRMIAYLAGETELIELAKDPSNDIHRIIGSLITGKEMWAITSEERSVGKRRNFGVVYLISAMGLAGQIFGPGYTQENVEFCQQQLDDFYRHFKRIDRYIKNNAKKVQKNGYMQTRWYNRKRLFTEIFDPNIEPARKASILRMANNVPVQGTAADYLKLAEVQMDNYIREKGWNELKDGFPRVRMMLSIHDEIIISADQTIPYEEIVKMITVCMETPVDDAPPFFVQPARMSSWADHSDDSLAMPIPFRDKIIKDYDRTGKSIFCNSYFRLDVPNDVQVEIGKSDAAIGELVERFYDRCMLLFDHGNYTREFNKDHVKKALCTYIESGFTTFRIDNYSALLKEYRDNELHDYMADLISKYGTDYKVVGEKVRHPSLTHDLIGNYSSKLKALDISHEEKIVEATRLYIEELLSKSDSSAEFVFKVPEAAKETDKDKFTEQLEATVNFDNDGNVIYLDNEDDEDTDLYAYDPDPDNIIYKVSEIPTYVWELADTLVFDVQDLKMDDVNIVLKYVFQHNDPNGFYRVQLIYNNRLIDTKMHAEQINIEEANNLVIQLHDDVRSSLYA
ncbi:MAG: DNA polymerase [Lachnospiraceae bacterium]|nr:DNA polymerase [Lachnospiraceae bacterium]